MTSEVLHHSSEKRFSFQLNYTKYFHILIFPHQPSRSQTRSKYLHICSALQVHSNPSKPLLQEISGGIFPLLGQRGSTCLCQSTAGGERWSFPFTQHWWVLWTTRSSSGLTATKGTWTYWRKWNRDSWRCYMDREDLPQRGGELTAWKLEGSGVILSKCINIR